MPIPVAPSPYSAHGTSGAARPSNADGVRVAIKNENVSPSFGHGACSDDALTRTLASHFGYNSYRPGQLPVIRCLLSSQDSAVFWATGSGKSLTYQIPPLHTNKIGIVISPLISLMQDQVAKLNGMGKGREVAAYLGSGQIDANVERKALNGEYNLVYLTPEKLLGGGFLDSLGRLHNSSGSGGEGKICLIAIDESHCVSEWGHDFRPEYRKLGQSIRSHVELRYVPLLALTATAVPRVQQDILTSLRMHDPMIVKQTFDRTNLDIVVKKKDRGGGGFRASLKPMVDEIIASSKASASAKTRGGQSTIIYVPTRDQVDEITSYLRSQLDPVGIRAEAYHAGLSQSDRSNAHTNFLVGKTTIIVATVAFGMGIDKPDTRRVVHYGPPKTVEEYYQQIGRAGRDGLRAQCLMFVSEGDFDKYKSDFYLGNLGIDAKTAVTRSIDALRNYALDSSACRRKALLDFFEEIPKFGERCGTCDNCLNRKKYGSDNERDFGPSGARIVLRVVDALNGPSMSVVEKVINGNVVESYRYHRGVDPRRLGETITEERKAMGKRRAVSYFRDLISPLVSRGYVRQGTRSGTSATGYSNTWTTYDLTSKGKNALHNTAAPILLPVPPSLREIERIEEEKRQATLAQLRDAGVDVDAIPKEEVESGDGEVIAAFKKWHAYLDSLRRADRLDRIDQLDDLKSRIEAWRSDAAVEYRMAPSTVMAEHTVVALAYATASMRPGEKLQREALLQAGVRTRGIEALLDALGEWVDDVQPKPSSDENTASGTTAAPMALPDAPFAPSRPWRHAVYKPMKKTGKASWESSYERFANGEHPQAIAISPENGRPIQVATVVSHVFDGLVQGRPVRLKRLAEASDEAPPNGEEWDRLRHAEEVTGMDVTGDPATSGRDGGKFLQGDFLRPIVGDELVDTPYNERTQGQKEELGGWYKKLKWYATLRRVAYVPTFDE